MSASLFPTLGVNRQNYTPLVPQTSVTTRKPTNANVDCQKQFGCCILLIGGLFTLVGMDYFTSGATHYHKPSTLAAFVIGVIVDIAALSLCCSHIFKNENKQTTAAVV